LFSPGQTESKVVSNLGLRLAMTCVNLRLRVLVSLVQARAQGRTEMIFSTVTFRKSFHASSHFQTCVVLRLRLARPLGVPTSLFLFLPGT